MHSPLRSQETCVVLDDQLFFSNHVTSISQLCISRKKKPYLTRHATQLLVQSWLSPFPLLQYGPSCVCSGPDCSSLVFSQSIRAHVSPLHIDLVGCNFYLYSVMHLHAICQLLLFSEQCHLVMLSLHTGRSQSKLFSSVVPQWWDKVEPC